MNDLILRHYNEDSCDRVNFFEGEEIVSVLIQDLGQKYNVNSVIRLSAIDFDFIRKDQKLLTHFNIQYCNHKEGEKYLILRIEVPGFFNGKNEMLPVLNKNNFFISKCLQVRNGLSYEELQEEDFRYSLDHIKNVNSLKKTIIRRYEKSLAHIPDEQKLLLGVSITKLEIIREIVNS